MKVEHLIYTVLEEWDENVVEKPIKISHYGPGKCPVLMELASEEDEQDEKHGILTYHRLSSRLIDSQQLAELGGLFLALAGNDVDLTSITELLDGYNLPVPDALKKVLEEA